MNRTLMILVVVGLLYFLWRRRASAMAAQNEWAEYAPTKFRVVAGGRSIVPTDDK